MVLMLLKCVRSKKQRMEIQLEDRSFVTGSCGTAEGEQTNCNRTEELRHKAETSVQFITGRAILYMIHCLLKGKFLESCQM